MQMILFAVLSLIAFLGESVHGKEIVERPLSELKLEFDSLRRNLEVESEKETSVASVDHLKEEQSVANLIKSIESGFPAIPKEFKEIDFIFGKSSISYSIKKLKICFALSTLEGISQNSGIGSVYYNIALLLANQGHEVTVVLTDSPVLRMRRSGKTMKSWISFYKKQGINLQVLPEAEVHLTVSDYQKNSYRLMKYLENTEYDIVSVPEYEGIAYYSLLAKDEGLKFENTRFVVGLHGPSRWVAQANEVQMWDLDLLEVDFMEQKCVQLADSCWSPSGEIVRWMKTERTWNVSEKEIYLMPYIPSSEEINFLPLNHVDQPIKEFVFFGRLEIRKGLELFCSAVEGMLEELAERNIKITFLGSSTAMRSDHSPRASFRYIQKKIEEWKKMQFTITVTILEDYGRTAALKYLKENNRVAVVPSLTDNAPLTAWECLQYRIPLIASDIPSISMMVKPEDRKKVLFNSGSVQSLQQLLHGTMEKLYFECSSAPSYGSTIPNRLSPHAKLVWSQLYYVSVSRKPFVSLGKQGKSELPLVSIVITHYNRPNLLAIALDSILEQDYKRFEVILVDDGSTDQEALSFLTSLEPQFSNLGWKIIRAEHAYLGAARNTGVRASSGEYLVFLDDDNELKPSFLSTYVTAQLNSHAQVLTAGHDVFEGKLHADQDHILKTWIPLGFSPQVGLFHNCFGDANFFVTRAAFDSVGGFTEDDSVGQEEVEFHSKVALNSVSAAVVPRSLLFYRYHASTQMAFEVDRSLSRMRAFRPYTAVLENQDEALQVLAKRSFNFDKRQNNENCSISKITEFQLNPRTFDILEPKVNFVVTNPDGWTGCSIDISFGIPDLACKFVEIDGNDYICEPSYPPIPQTDVDVWIVDEGDTEAPTRRIPGALTFTTPEDKNSVTIRVNFAEGEEIDEEEFVDRVAGVLNVDDEDVKVSFTNDKNEVVFTVTQDEDDDIDIDDLAEQFKNGASQSPDLPDDVEILGTCKDGVCVCNANFQGEFCTEPTDCVDDCNSHGECVVGEFERVCDCDPEYLGLACEFRSCSVNGNECNNRGSCVADALSNNGKCECDDGWRGPECAAPDCPVSDCNGNGVCNDAGQCDCEDGWAGDTCAQADGEPLSSWIVAVIILGVLAVVGVGAFIFVFVTAN